MYKRKFQSIKKAHLIFSLGEIELCWRYQWPQYNDPHTLRCSYSHSHSDYSLVLWCTYRNTSPLQSMKQRREMLMSRSVWCWWVEQICTHRDILRSKQYKEIYSAKYTLLHEKINQAYWVSHVSSITNFIHGRMNRINMPIHWAHVSEMATFHVRQDQSWAWERLALIAQWTKLEDFMFHPRCDNYESTSHGQKNPTRYTVKCTPNVAIKIYIKTCRSDQWRHDKIPKIYSSSLKQDP